jgi:hypothetical protein
VRAAQHIIKGENMHNYTRIQGYGVCFGICHFPVYASSVLSKNMSVMDGKGLNITIEKMCAVLQNKFSVSLQVSIRVKQKPV